MKDIQNTWFYYRGRAERVEQVNQLASGTFEFIQCGPSDSLLYQLQFGNGTQSGEWRCGIVSRKLVNQFTNCARLNKRAFIAAAKLLLK